MTERHSAYVVVLDHDIREDDAEATINALRMVRGVVNVQPAGIDAITETVMRSRIRVELSDSLLRWMRENLQ